MIHPIVPDLLSGFLTSPQAALALRRDESTLKRWRRSGKGPRPCWIGGRLYYRKADLQTWIEEEAARERPSMTPDAPV